MKEIPHIVQNFAQHAKPQEAAKHDAKFHMVCEIFLYTDSVRFLSPNILHNFLFSPCNQPRYFLLYFFVFFGNIFGGKRERDRGIKIIEHL